MTGIDRDEVDLALQPVLQVAHQRKEGAGFEVGDGDIDIGASMESAGADDRTEQDRLVDTDRRFIKQAQRARLHGKSKLLPLPPLPCLDPIQDVGIEPASHFPSIRPPGGRATGSAVPLSLIPAIAPTGEQAGGDGVAGDPEP